MTSLSATFSTTRPQQTQRIQERMARSEATMDRLNNNSQGGKCVERQGGCGAEFSRSRSDFVFISVDRHSIVDNVV